MAEPTPWTQNELDKLVKLYRDGVMPMEIQRALGRNKWQIKNALQRLRMKGVDLPQRRAGRPTSERTRSEGEIAAEIGSARLRDAMLAYYAKHIWREAA